jgi:hypothetical protein
MPSKVLHPHLIRVKIRWVNNWWVYLVRILVLLYRLLTSGISTGFLVVSRSSWILLHLECKFILKGDSLLIIEIRGPVSPCEVALERLLITTHIFNCAQSKWRLCVSECLLLLHLIWDSILALDYFWRNHSGGLMGMNKILRVVWRERGIILPVIVHCALLSAPVQLHVRGRLYWGQNFFHWS